MSELQVRLLHSHIAGNNAYKAWLDSGSDLAVFAVRLAEANNPIWN